MSRPARFQLIWALVLTAITLLLAVLALSTWLRNNRPPIYTMWPEHMLLAAGGYQTYNRFKAFRKLNAIRR